MEKDLKSGKQIDPLLVKTQLDEILAREITSFIDVDSDAAMMSFNLATISCITVIIEREREIRQYADFPPERYMLDDFTGELVDIGLERDDYLETAIASCLKSGYISENQKGEFKAEMPAFMTVGFLDSMFPGMQGMNLIAFILQMNHEVISGRKTLELAKQSFESTLKSRGVSVSRDHAEKRASDMVSGAQKPPVQAKEISNKLKKENLGRLSTLMKTRKKRSGEYAQKVKIKDVFDKGPSKEEIATQKVEMEKAEDAARRNSELARQLAEKDEKIKQAEKTAEDATKHLKELKEKELALKEAQVKSEEFAAMEAQMAQREAQLKAMEERIKQKEEEVRREYEAKLQDTKESEENKVITAQEDIESQIAAFESELAMPCPLCSSGQIEEKTTEKGKQFFSCTKADCRFVSWDKPYHFECPLCKNPFLIELQVAGDKKGLKCPRAACSYSQNNLLDPKQNMASAAADSKPKKKRRVVRRKRR